MIVCVSGPFHSFSFASFSFTLFTFIRYNKHKGLLNKIQVSDNKYRYGKEQKKGKNTRNTKEKRIKLLMPIFVNFDIIKKIFYFVKVMPWSVEEDKG